MRAMHSNSSSGSMEAGADIDVVSACAGYAAQLIDQEEARLEVRTRCSQRLRREPEQAQGKEQEAEAEVLANVEWAVDRLEAALHSGNTLSSRAARLEHCHKLLKGAARAGIRYLAAWSHLYLALLCKLRARDRAAAAHLLDMFVLDPRHARLDFGPDLWDLLFLPHLSNVHAWYKAECAKLAALSARKELLDKLYQETLDDNTRQYAQYYRDRLQEDRDYSRSTSDSSLTRSPPAAVDAAAGGWKVSTNSVFNTSISFQDEDRDASREDAARDLSSSLDMSFKEPEAEDSTSHESDKGLVVHPVGEQAQRMTWDNPVDGRPGGGFESPSTFQSVSDKRTAAAGLASGRLAKWSAAARAPREREALPQLSSSESSDYSELEARRHRFVEGRGRHGQEEVQSLSTGLSNLSTEPAERKSVRTHHPHQQQQHQQQQQQQQQRRPSSELGHIKPPKHFVCPITHELFDNPVTLETGQTYERFAIQDWLDQGNKTCPLTQQTLTNLSLPQTNSVLKGLVDAWKEQNPEVVLEDLPRDPSIEGWNVTTFPDRNGGIIHGQVPQTRAHLEADAHPPYLNIDTLLTDLQDAVSSLCSLDAELSELEDASLRLARVWVRSEGDEEVEVSLLNVAVVERLMHLLSVSTSDIVLRTTVCLLCELLERNDFIHRTIVEWDPDLKVLMHLVTLGSVPQVAVLLYLLKESPMQQEYFKGLPFFVDTLKDDILQEEGAFDVCWTPRAAAAFLIEEMVTMFDHSVNMAIAVQLVNLRAIPALISSLHSTVMEEKISAATILRSCIQADGSCRDAVATGCKTSSIVELLHCNKGKAMTTAISLLFELIQLDRRSIVTRMLSEVQKEGYLSSLHVLLVHLQVAPLEERPRLAGLLLQIDLLVGVRRNSMFREEALESLIEALGCKDNEEAQLQALKVLLSLAGRFTESGVSLTEDRVLSEAGYDGLLGKGFGEKHGNQDHEEKAATVWEKRVATVLLQDGKPLFEALRNALASDVAEVTTMAVTLAAYLSSALKTLPDIGMLPVVAQQLLPDMVGILTSNREMEERVMAAYCLESYVADAVARDQFLGLSKELFGPLRRLKQLTWCAKALLRTLATSPVVAHADMWAHGEIGTLDSRMNGEIRALVYGGGFLYSGHADGAIKIWDVTSSLWALAEEVKEHTRAVSCLALQESNNRLLSGSADKTIRVWVLAQEKLKCIQVVELKESVQSVAFNEKITCFITQGMGLKLLKDNSPTKTLYGGKHVESISVVGDKIYCGCGDNSIQEVDAASGQVVALQSGVRTLLGKKPVYAVHVYNGFLYTAGTPVDGVAVKVWNREDRSLSATIPGNADVRAIAVNEEFVYLGCSSVSGSIEVWLREKLVKVATLNLSSRLTALAVDGDNLYSAHADGHIRVWALL